RRRLRARHRTGLGTRYRIRTCDLWLRRPTLYPAELSVRERRCIPPGAAGGKGVRRRRRARRAGPGARSGQRRKKGYSSPWSMQADTPSDTARPRPTPRTLERVVIRFAGDSGDGMQLTGTEFTKAAAAAGNDISTFPDFPAEIRAPAGSLAGVSGFQLHFASSEIYTPGDAPDVLIAMNPAALRTNLRDLVPGGTLIVNTGTFTGPNLKKAGYQSDPLDDDDLNQRYRIHRIDITKMTNAALEGTALTSKEKGRCKNFFALGLMFWAYSRDPETELAHIRAKFSRDERLADA